MRITQSGQVTIPESIRRSAGLLPGTEVEFVQDKQGVRLRPVAGRKVGSGGLVVQSAKASEVRTHHP